MKRIDIKSFLKSEIVTVISFGLAVISLFIVPIDGQYLEYIDFRTLAILLSLMLVVAGFRKLGVFKSIGSWLLTKSKNARELVLVFVLLCFCFSMLITNDVALITFVPFAMEVLYMAELEKYLIPAVVLETIAANLGSMFTPIGNPQNLYLYSLSGMGMGQFLLLMLPYSLVSLLGLAAATVLLIKKDPLSVSAFSSTKITKMDEENEKNEAPQMALLVVYMLLFLLCLVTVARLVPYYVVLAVVFMMVFLFDRSTIKEADYFLLLTFLFLFVFIGNMGRIPQVNGWLSSIGKEHVAVIGMVSSQIISNVPAAILLSGFTTNYEELIVGVNLGGLGTLIASMASLISYKFYSKSRDSRIGLYLGQFTIWNLIFLLILCGLHMLIRQIL